MSLLQLLQKHDAILMEEERLISNGFCYNPEQLEAKLEELNLRKNSVMSALHQKLCSCLTRRQYDNLLATINDFTTTN